jgi:HEAT repeat protein
MRKRRYLLIALACVLLAGLLFAAAPERDPEYQGYRLNQWLVFLIERTEDDPDYPSPRQLQAQQVIKRFGANASPFLLKWIRHETPFWRQKLPASIMVHLPDSVQIDRAELRATGAQEALKLLGPAAGNVIPELNTLMTDPEAWETAERAMKVLPYMGPNALPPLLQALAKPSEICRSHVADAIGHFLELHPEATSAVPVLVTCLKDSDPVVPLSSAWALGNPKLPATLVVPPLVAALQSSNAVLRWHAAHALGKCQATAAAAVPFLKESLDDPDTDVANMAAESLRAIEGEAPTNAAAD